MATVYRRTVKASTLPTEWREEGRFSPEEEVTVTVTPANPQGNGSPKRFIGAGKGLFGSAKDIDAYLQRNRDAWRS